MPSPKTIYLVNKPKIDKEKILLNSKIICVSPLVYKNKNYFIIGIKEKKSNKLIEIYDPTNLESMGKNDTEFRQEYIENIEQIYDQQFAVLGTYLSIFAFYSKNGIFHFNLVQKIIKIPIPKKFYLKCSRLNIKK